MNKINQAAVNTASSDHASLLPLAAALLALGCAGCAVGPDYQRPALPVADQYVRTPVQATAAAPVAGGEAQRFLDGKEVSTQWWKEFGSAQLDDLVAQAFAHNPTVSSAQAALRGAQENLAAQRAAFFPSAQVSYSPSRQQNASGTISPTLTSGQPLYTLHTSQLNIAYVPDVFGLNRRSVESLAAQEETQQFQLDATYLTLASNVVAAAVQAASLNAQIKGTQEIVDTLSKSVEMLHKQAASGYATGFDVAAQEAALAQAQQGLPQLIKQREQTQDLLALLTGQLPAQWSAREFQLDAMRLPQDLPLALPSSLVEQRPDVRAAEAQVHVASAQVGVAVANRFPQFSISAQFGGSSTEFAHMFSAGNKFWGVTGSIAQTVFDAGALKHKQGAAEAGLDQATAQYRSVVLGAFQNVADTLYALDADAKTLEAAARSEAATQKAMDLTRQQFEIGYVNGLALAAAQQAYQQAKIARIQAQAARYADTAALYQALGGGISKRGERQ